MKMYFMKMIKNKNFVPILVCSALLVFLILLPTGYEDAAPSDGSERVAARVLTTDENMIFDTGMVRTGEQVCELEILEGKWKGVKTSSSNFLTGSLEQDKIFKAGDKALVMVSSDESSIVAVSMIDHHRMNWEMGLAIVFFAFLIIFSGWMGVRTILSFILAILVIWKVLIPNCLNGYDPIVVGGIVAALLVVVIISMVYGFDRRFMSAVTGSLIGLLVTAIMGIICTKGFYIHGAVMDHSESLLYSGYMNLDLTRIFMASIFIGCSGAMVDLAVDITSAVNEVIVNCPGISKKDAIMSGIRVGRDTMGTMTTTLLLAYSGGFIGLMMVFMAQGTPIVNIFNYKYVAAEIVHTLVGSFGLVTVAPLTAVTSGVFLTGTKAAIGEE